MGSACAGHKRVTEATFLPPELDVYAKKALSKHALLPAALAVFS